MKEIIWWLLNRIFVQNKNNLIAVIGETGSGKSLRALRIAEQLLKGNVKLNENLFIVFHVEDFLKLLAEGKLKKGCVIIWEEGGVEASNRNWFSLQNKLVTYAFQTMRHRNFTLIMTVPSLNYIDAGLRSLFHMIIECIRVDFENDTCVCKILRRQHNPLLGWNYDKYFRIVHNGRKITVKNVCINRPSKPLEEEYERMKTDYTNTLYQQSLEELQASKLKAKTDFRKPNDYTKIIEEVQAKIYDYVKVTKNGSEKVDVLKIKQHYKLSQMGAYEVAHSVVIPN